MAKFLVQAAQRQGYDGVWRAGRKWQSSGPTEVDVVDQDEDPPADPSKGVVLGKKSWQAIMDDQFLTKLPAGDPLALAKQSDDIAYLRKEVERLTVENASLRTQLEEGKAVRPEARGKKHAE